MSSSSQETQIQPDDRIQILMAYAERMVKLEQEQKELKTQIAELSAIKEDTTGLKEQLAHIQDILKELKEQSEHGQSEDTVPVSVEQSTDVSEALKASQKTTITNQPTVIHPPKPGSGHRGARHWRRDHRSED